MAGENLDRQALSFARMAYRRFSRQLVFQRLPTAAEGQTDEWGFPKQGDANRSDIDANNPIPTQFTIGSRRDLIIGGQQHNVTTFKVTIPRLYKNNGVWQPVDFSTEYRAHVLYKNEQNQERFFQVVGDGLDLGPDITFEAIELEQKV